jgi:hypothetical protein
MDASEVRDVWAATGGTVDGKDRTVVIIVGLT